MMNTPTFSQASANLENLMDQVCQDHSPAIITRTNGESVVMLSQADYNSMEETMYLLSSAKNASRLMESIAQLREGKAKQRALIRHEKQEDTEQAASQA